jgi:two-component system response regulator YesN
MVCKTLLADDEIIIREGIAQMLSGDKEICIVGQAADGEIALQMAGEHLPDILLVDIDMPFLSGLEFIERLSEFLHGAVIIIITGYDDYQYMQKALRLGVFDYLLKPVIEDTLLEVIAKAKRRIAENQKQVNYLQWARTQVKQNMPSIRNTFFSSWLNGSLSEPEVQKQIEYLNLNIQFPCCMMIVSIGACDFKHATVQGWDDNIIFFAAENIAAETFSPISPVITHQNEHGDLVLFIATDDYELVQETSVKLADHIERFLPIKAYISQDLCEWGDKMPETYLTLLDNINSGINCSELVTLVKRYVAQNFSVQGLSLQSVASKFYVSPEHLSRLFRHETGTTFVDYITQTRIRKAMRLLLKTNIKIHEIALQTGYSSQHYFSIAFKRVFGVSPVEFRKKHL